MASFTTANTGDTEREIISSIVQEQLLQETKLLHTVRDVSSMVEKGMKTLELPRFDSRFAGPATQNPDGETPVTAQTLDLATDVLALDQWKNLPYRIPDRIAMQSAVPLQAELAKSAGSEMAIYVDQEIAAQLKLAADGTGGLPDHIIQMSGTSNLVITLGDITEARRLLNVANVRDDGNRFLSISPEQEKAMLNIDNFIKANEYGSREALLNGEVGRVFGFRVVVSNSFSGAEAVAYHKDCVAIGFQKGVDFEAQRADVTIRATDYSYAVGWGRTVLEQGVKQVYLNATGS